MLKLQFWPGFELEADIFPLLTVFTEIHNKSHTALFNGTPINHRFCRILTKAYSILLSTSEGYRQECVF